MSHSYRKIEYEMPGSYGSTDKGFLLIDYNNTSDTTSVYDEGGNHLFTYGDWGDFDMGAAITVALNNFTDKRLQVISKREFEELTNPFNLGDDFSIL